MLGTIDRGHVARIVEALSRGDGPGLLVQVQELDRDAPDYDRALVESGGDPTAHRDRADRARGRQNEEEFDAQTLLRLAQAMSAEDVQLYYQIALGGRRDLPWRPIRGLGFEMTLLRMLAFRPETAAAAIADGTRSRAPAASSSRAPAAAPRHRSRRCADHRSRRSHGPPMHRSRRAHLGAVTVPEPLAPHAAVPPAIDADSWPEVVAAAQLSGMARQFALNCVPASFDNGVLTLRLDRSVDARRSRAIEEKLVQGFSKYFGRDIRVSSNLPTRRSRRRRVSVPWRSRIVHSAPRRHSKRIRRSKACGSDSVPRWMPLR